MDRNTQATITDTFANASSTSLTGSLYFPSQPVNLRECQLGRPRLPAIECPHHHLCERGEFWNELPAGLGRSRVSAASRHQRGPRRMTNWTPKARLPVLTGHLWRNQRGVAAVEFGLVCDPFSRFCFRRPPTLRSRSGQTSKSAMRRERGANTPPRIAGTVPPAPSPAPAPPTSQPPRRQSWPDKLGQLDKWSFCLTTAKMAVEQERR